MEIFRHLFFSEYLIFNIRSVDGFLHFLFVPGPCYDGIYNERQLNV